MDTEYSSSPGTNGPRHQPVMMAEVLRHLCYEAYGSYMDCTFGRGGYARAILEQDPKNTLVALDRDPEAQRASDNLQQDYPGRFDFHLLCNDQIGDVGTLHNRFDGIVWDLGVSSPQLDTPERGFSFRHCGPLDMRMGESDMTAADVVNTVPENDLADIIYTYGGERRSRAVARKICQERQNRPLQTTQELAELVRSVVRKSRDGIDPATRTFQALRIFVNDELGQLQRSLAGALLCLKKTGVMVVVSFHSLEDRIVKQFFQQKSCVTEGALSDGVPSSKNAYRFEILTKKPLTPTAAECHSNPRSRSAKLRACRIIRGPDT